MAVIKLRRCFVNSVALVGEINYVVARWLYLNDFEFLLATNPSYTYSYKAF